VGSSWVLSDLLAGVLVGQLERFDDLQRRRHAIWDRYHAGTAGWAATHGVRRPLDPVDAPHTAHLYHLRFASLDERTRFIAHLRDRDVLAVFHYQPLHLSTVGERLGGRRGQHPVTEDAGDTLVRLPLFAGLRDDEVDRVLDAVTSFRP
jgi:dTDP-4-amino-4,6-dideoxygalactose transaminase